MTKVLLRTLVGWAVLALPVSAHATSVAMSSPTNAQICAQFDCGAALSTTDTFDFGNNGVDGTVTSYALTGISGSAGEYLYGYQIALNADADDPVVHGFALLFPGLDIPFACSDCGGGPKTPSLASYAGTSLSFSFLDLSGLGLANEEIYPGDTTRIFGGISNLGPTFVTANMIDGGSPVIGPQVYAPGESVTPPDGGGATVPEPGTVLLLGTGLVGLALLGRWRERSGG